VEQTDANAWVISSRGLDGPNRLQHPPFQVCFLEQVDMQMPLKHAERIEVIRGSEASFRGVNAANGVISTGVYSLGWLTAALLVLSLLISLGPCPLLAQDAQAHPNLMDMSLEDLMKVEIDSVYGASGYKQKVTEAPASITIITADEIQRYGYQTLADVLRNVPGFYVTYDRNYSYLGIRGFSRPGDYNSRILLLVDGHRTNDNIFGEALIGPEFPLDIDLIDRVEVIRGPNSSLYVASAFLGVINIITKPVSKQNNLTASADVASYGTYKSRLTYGHQFSDGLELLVSGTDYNSTGQNLFFPEFDSPATNYGMADNSDYEESHQFFTNLTYGDFCLEGVYGSREKGIPTGSFGDVFNDNRARTVDARGWLDLAYDHRFGSDWGFMSRIYYDNYHYDGIYPSASVPDGSTILNKDISNGIWWGAQFAVSKQLFNNQTLVIGSEYQDNIQQYQTNYNEQPYFLYFNSRPSSNLWAVYAQDEIGLGHNVTLDVGLRHDQYSTFGGTTNPRAGLIYQPFEKTTVKLLYGQSFRAPNAYELYYAGYGEEGNLHLRPETVKTTELVLEQYFHGGVRMLISGYFYPVRNLISQSTDATNGDIVYINSERVDMRGVEISLKKQWRSGMEVGTAFSLQDANQVGSQTPLNNSPRVLSQNNVSVPLFRRRLFASAAVDYVSRRLTTAGNYAGAYVLPDVTLLSNSSKRWEISASLYNAFNQKYADPGSIGDPEDVIIQNGRNFRLKFTYRFF
jgi:iron complex outermembrane receptor protein